MSRGRASLAGACLGPMVQKAFNLAGSINTTVRYRVTIMRVRCRPLRPYRHRFVNDIAHQLGTSSTSGDRIPLVFVVIGNARLLASYKFRGASQTRAHQSLRIGKTNMTGGSDTASNLDLSHKATQLSKARWCFLDPVSPASPQDSRDCQCGVTRLLIILRCRVQHL